jgi:diguanylate cyclase (GGDEF)-like protein
MNGYQPELTRTVKLTGSPENSGNSTDTSDARRATTAGLVLRSQAPARMIAAALASAMQLFILFRIGGRSSLSNVLPAVTAVVGLYMVGLVVTHYSLWRDARASDERVTCILALDLAFVYLMTASTSTPSQYARALLGMIVVLHVAKTYFGSRHAWHTVELGVIGYIGLLYYATVSLQPVDVINELWTLLVAAAGSALIIHQGTNVQRRLQRLVTLFENAEDGDFSQAYDVVADRQPDEVTRVGHAYNRVREQLSSMVLTDPLTGCLNRRGFDQALAREVARATRTGDCFALIALDLDHFKHVNDTHGHLAGDAMLRDVGAILLAAGRAGDVVARMGGEEFAILLPSSGNHGANNFAARLCDRIREYEFIVGAKGQRVSLTVSIGVAVGSPLGEPNFAALLWSRADAALYAAKRAGRDCARAWMNETEFSGEHAVIGSLEQPASL